MNTNLFNGIYNQLKKISTNLHLFNFPLDNGLSTGWNGWSIMIFYRNRLCLQYCKGIHLRKASLSINTKEKIWKNINTKEFGWHWMYTARYVIIKIFHNPNTCKVSKYLSVKNEFESVTNGTPLGKRNSISKRYLMLTMYSKTHFKILKPSWPLDE